MQIQPYSNSLNFRMRMKHINSFPKIGLRILKSAVAVFLCYVFNYFRGESGIVFYSQLSALWCIQSYISTTKKNARQRIFGTFVGAGFGLLILLSVGFLRTEFKLSGLNLYAVQALITSASIVLVLYSTVVTKKKQASYFSCVVFLSIVVIHISDANPYLFALNRFIDTMVGIIIGVGVNLFRLPKKRHTEILFISGLDDTLLNSEYHLNDYCKVELNRMIDKGLHFTLSTMRPPASIMEPMKDIQLKLPVIAMDGAVLYDTREKRFLENIHLDAKDGTRIKHLLEEYKIIYFANVVMDDTLLIFYNQTSDNPLDEKQSELIRTLRKSPYRNYISRPVPETENIVYFMMFYPKEKAKEIYSMLESHDFTKDLKILIYPSKDYDGYCYIKIFNKFATKENMIELMKRKLGISNTITFGTIPSKYDYVVTEGDTNEVVHKMKMLFEG